jgi:hypothetical protein
VVWYLAQAAMPPARKAIDSTLYRSEATWSNHFYHQLHEKLQNQNIKLQKEKDECQTVRLATATSGFGSSPASRIVMPADQASKIFIAQDAQASWAKGCQSCTEAGHHEHMIGMGAQCQQSPGKEPARLENLVPGRYAVLVWRQGQRCHGLRQKEGSTPGEPPW